MRSHLVKVVVVAIAVGSAPMMSVAAAPAASAPLRSDYVVLARSSTALDRVLAEVRSERGRISHVYRHALSGFAASLTDAQVAALRRDPGVRAVERDVPIFAAAQDLPTGLDRISLPASQGATNQGVLNDGVDDARADVDIAIIDSGSGPHPDIDVVARTNCMVSPCVDGSGNDQNGHGSHVAGTAAAIDNGIGTVGVAAGARVWSVQVLDQNGSGQLSWLVAGMNWVTARASSIEVANMSISCACISPSIDTAISNSVAAGVAYAVAAGNADQNAGLYSISNHPDVMTVSALADFDGVSGGTGGPTCRSDQDDTLADFSNWGSVVDLAAPGVCIKSAWLSNGYNTISGTSMASPHVAGAAGMLASQPAYRGNPSLIRTTLISAGNLGWTDDSGDGVKEPLLDVTNLTAVTVPPPPPAPTTTTYQESHSAIAYSGPWTNQSRSADSGGAVRYAISGPATASFTFTGTGIRWLSRTSPHSGIAAVYLDGVLVANVDRYTASTFYQQTVFSRSGLGAGTHTIRIEHTGTTNPAALDDNIILDAFIVEGESSPPPPPTNGPGTYQESHSAIGYSGPWTSQSRSGDSGGAIRYAISGPATASFTFTGTEIRWLSRTSPHSGIAAVYLDGVLVANVDRYTASTFYQQTVFSRSGLGAGTHTIRIEHTGTTNPAALDDNIILDAFIVG